MAKFFIFVKGFAAALLLVGMVWVGYRAYMWRQYANTRLYYAEVTGAYLFNPSGVSTVDGKPLSRQELLDLVLHQVAAQSPGLKFDPPAERFK